MPVSTIPLHWLCLKFSTFKIHLKQQFALTFRLFNFFYISLSHCSKHRHLVAALVASGECSQIFCLVRASDSESAQRRVEEVQKPSVQNWVFLSKCCHASFVDLSVQFNPIHSFLLSNSSKASFLGKWLLKVPLTDLLFPRISIANLVSPQPETLIPQLFTKVPRVCGTLPSGIDLVQLIPKQIPLLNASTMVLVGVCLLLALKRNVKNDTLNY